jgi:small subunit ribosomal protein S21
MRSALAGRHATIKGVNPYTTYVATGVWPVSGSEVLARSAQAERMKVDRRDGETVEQLLRRFNKGVVSERITKTYREKMHFVSKSEQRKEKRRRAERNRRKKAARS